MPCKHIIKELSIILGLSVVCALGYNALSQKGLALFGDWDTSKGVISARAKDDMVFHDLEIDDVLLAKIIYDSGAIFVDARSVEDYEECHIEGAISLPAWDFESHIEAFRDMVPLDAVVVTYCSGRECDDSHELAQQLLMVGYMDVRVFIDGFPGWEAEGFPISESSYFQP